MIESNHRVLLSFRDKFIEKFKEYKHINMFERAQVHLLTGKQILLLCSAIYNYPFHVRNEKASILCNQTYNVFSYTPTLVKCYYISVWPFDG